MGLIVEKEKNIDGVTAKMNNVPVSVVLLKGKMSLRWWCH